MDFSIYTLFFIFVVNSNAHKDPMFVLIVALSILLIVSSIYDLFQYKFILKIRNKDIVINTSKGLKEINIEDIEECSLINSNRKEVLYISVKSNEGRNKNIFIKQEEIFVRLRKVEKAINNLIK